MEVKKNRLISIIRKLGFWFSVLVIFPGIFFISLFPDFFYPEIPWETSINYNNVYLSNPDRDFYLQIDIISFYEDVRGDGDEIYGVQPTLFGRDIIHALEDKEKIGKFLRIVHDADQGLKGSANCFIQDGQKEIHVVTFDYANNKAGYFVMHFCKVKDQFITMLKFHDDHWTSYVSESAEMTEFLSDLGIEPNE